MPALRLLITGRVQGVGYRDWTRREAVALGLCGWVRNLRDGRVEAVASGTDLALARFVRALRERPALARVDSVEQSAAEDVSDPGFEVRSTA
jgi:acylphosphatase